MNGISETFHPSAHLSHYIPEFLKGSHDLKVGVEPQFFKTLRGGGYPGGETFYDYDGAPLLKYVQQPYNNDNYFRSIMGFVQDTWTLYKRLTLNLGFRYDNYWYKIPSPTVGVVYKNGNISPRLGLTYDLLGDRKNLLKLFYGHYYEGLFGNFFANLEDRYSDLIAYSWDGAEYVEFMRTKYEKLYEIDPNVKHPYLREISGGYERELFKDASLTLNFYYRFLGRTLGAVNTGAKYKKVTIANPGPDGIPGTSDDQGTLDVYDQLNPGQDKYLITNPKKGMSESMIDDIKKTMYGFEVIFNKRLSKRWQMIASYHYTKAKGNTDNVLSYLGTNPNSFVNAYGESAYYYGQPHQFKFQGTVLLPLDINLGINAQYISGQITQPYFYTVLSQGYSYLRGEPPGKTRTDPRTDFDIRFEKRFPVLNGNLSLMADVFNLFNTHETPFAWNRWNMYGPDYDKITSVKEPRTFRIGLRFVY